MQNATTAPPANDTESGSNAECHQTRALSPVWPWRLEIIRAVLLGTHDAQSPLCQLRGQRSVLELIIRGWAWPELFRNALLAAMLEANPGVVTEAKLRQNLSLNPDGSIRSWDLKRCGLRALPELFGAVCATGHLLLNNNQLSSLPDSFGSITVGGSLNLSNNQLRSLPDSFGSIIVGGDLDFDTAIRNQWQWHEAQAGINQLNPLSSLPDSFGSITVGGSLYLSSNQLRSLPDSFGSITVGGDLYFTGNQLRSLPDSFGSITVGRDLYLSCSKLSWLPDSFGSITVGRNLELYAQLSWLPDSFGSITVGGDLRLNNTQLDDQTIPTHFPNVGGDVHISHMLDYGDLSSEGSDYLLDY